MRFIVGYDHANLSTSTKTNNIIIFTWIMMVPVSIQVCEFCSFLTREVTKNNIKLWHTNVASPYVKLDGHNFINGKVIFWYVNILRQAYTALINIPKKKIGDST